MGGCGSHPKLETVYFEVGNPISGIYDEDGSHLYLVFFEKELLVTGVIGKYLFMLFSILYDNTSP